MDCLGGTDVANRVAPDGTVVQLLDAAGHLGSPLDWPFDLVAGSFSDNVFQIE